MHSMQIILVYVYVKRIALVMYVKGINVNITDSDSCPLIHLINCPNCASHVQPSVEGAENPRELKNRGLRSTTNASAETATAVAFVSFNIAIVILIPCRLTCL